MIASDGAAWDGDLRRGDVVLGVLVAALVVGASGAGVVSQGPSNLAWIGPREVVVPIQPVFEAPAHDVSIPASPHAASTAALPPDLAVTDAAAPAWSSSEAVSDGEASFSSAGPALATVPPRPADAPPAASELPPRPRGGIKALPRLSSPHAPLPGVASEPGFGPGGPGVAPGPADPEDSPSDPYAYVDPRLEDTGADPGAPGLIGGAPPTVDPAAERALAIFRQRLQRWISVHFVVSGAGLSARERDGASVRAVLVLDGERTLVDYTVEAGGHPALRAAAEGALQILLGSRAPEPPEHYPGPVQRTIHVTFRCTEATCD